jgi:L-rhamnose mutarotase
MVETRCLICLGELAAGDIMPSNPDHSPVSAPRREVFHSD